MNIIKANTEVQIYTKSNCSQCVSTKNLFKKLDIKYNEVSIEENPEVLTFLKNEGFMAAPVVITATDSWAGFNETKIRNIKNSIVDADGDF